MADPVTIGLIVASTAVSAMGAISAGNAQAQEGLNQASAAQTNKLYADQDRQRNVQNARIAAEDKARANRRQLAAIRASYGTSGVELSGSPLEVLQDTSIEMALDERRTEAGGYEANREGFIKMNNYDTQAMSATAGAKSASSAGWLSAGGTALSGAASASAYNTKVKTSKEQ